MLKKVKVKSLPDRIARVSPRGQMIPTDRFISVPLTSYMRRLIEVHGDVIVEPEKKEEPAAKPAPAPTKAEPTKADTKKEAN